MDNLLKYDKKKDVKISVKQDSDEWKVQLYNPEVCLDNYILVYQGMKAKKV